MSRLSNSKPNFFILGAPKAGTTALSHYLSSHPDVLFSNPKEPHYFNTDFAPAFRRCLTLDEYLHCFDPRELELRRAVGEGSVWYLSSAEAVPNILRFNPEAAFIVMVRNPVELAASLHSQMLWGGEEAVAGFREAWDLQEARRAGRRIPSTTTEPRILQYGEIAQAGEQLERLYHHVPPERVLVGVFDDLRSDPGALYHQVLDFLGLEHDDRRDFPVVNANRRLRSMRAARLLHHARAVKLRLGVRRSLGVWRVLAPFTSRSASRDPLPVDLRGDMQRFFRDDVGRLSELLGRDLSHWVEPVRRGTG